MSHHDQLPYRVPPICEHCCAPVEVTHYGPNIVTSTDWPGCGGHRVFFHAGCAVIAARQIHRAPRPAPPLPRPEP